MSQKLKVAFIHPDLGLGGAERLVVDAALGLQKLGRNVAIFTSHHDAKRCFVETKDGTLDVKAIHPPIPRAIAGKFHILLAHLRQLHLLINILLFHYWNYDVFFVDQLSTCVPFLRTLTGRRVVFYCHFPDKLLANGAYVEDRRAEYANLKEMLWLYMKKLYRLPMDLVEELTTNDADVILANSNFTATVVARHLPSIANRTTIVYPGINVQAYKPSPDQEHELVFSHRPTFLSLNRFEVKKKAVRAVQAFADFKVAKPELWSESSAETRPRLVLGGGYDHRVEDNRSALLEILDLIAKHNLSFFVNDTAALSILHDAPRSSRDIQTADVLLILNFTSSERSTLLNSPSTLALIYTPENEHFGIGPVEGMICGLPVVACESGGPTETVLPFNAARTRGTGWLLPPRDEAAWARVLVEISEMSPSQRREIATRGQERANEFFGMDRMASRIEVAIEEAWGMGRVRVGYGLRLGVGISVWMVIYWVLMGIGFSGV